MKKCVVDVCKSNSDSSLQSIVTFFNFPERKDDKRFGQWAEAVGKTPDFLNSHDKFICSRHFRPEDFVQSAFLEVNGTTDVKTNLTLINNAVPSLYLSFQDKEPPEVSIVKTESESEVAPIKDVKIEIIDIDDSDEDLTIDECENDNTENSLGSNVVIKEEIIISDIPKNETTETTSGEASPECTTCLDFQKKLSEGKESAAEEEEFRTLSQNFEIHKQSHISPSKKKFSCTECGEKFFWSKEVKKHKLLNHSSFRCDCCHKRFLKISNLKYHKREKHNILEAFQCDSCDRAFFNSRELWQHMKIHREVETDRCTKCRKKFATKEDFYKHVCAYDNKPYRCELCKKGFMREITMDTHKKKYHTGKEESQKADGKGLKCEVCGRFYKHIKSLRSHKLSHTSSYKCDKCDKRFPGPSHLKAHQLVHTGVECFNLGKLKY